MANLRTDSPVACRIVRAFLDFLNSVEAGPGVDVEGLEVAKQCLEQVFQVESPAADELTELDSLVEIFSSPESFQRSRTSSFVDNGAIPFGHHSPLNVNDSDANLSESKPQGGDWSRESHSVGVLQDELFGQFVLALEKLHYFRTTADGRDDPDQLERATRLFHDALREMERSGCPEINHKNLAESLKSLGLCSQNFTLTQLSCIAVQLHYVKIMPFTTVTALQLDPNNEAVRENIRVAEQKLKEAQRQTQHEQGSTSRSQESQNQSGGGGSRNDSPPSPPFPSMPFNVTLPSGISDMFMNMAANATNPFHGQHSEDGGEENRSRNGSGDPRTNMNGNFSFSIGDGMPQDLNGALRSMMQMFTGAAPGGNPQNNFNGRPPQG
ncbi:uncharacterized protein LOC120085593 isoform X4 [Benincasa hispida]|uniref:uncharacterized protein LOC120085593 isoform X4 n=1 Tax=Benincasa hispida TaxID=102211 RepID=UPI0019013923|nr:uncharacterized protein LOC120085593 isoform X4 [Benincasa hispida]